jgi:hypothetical protein
VRRCDPPYIGGGWLVPGEYSSDPPLHHPGARGASAPQAWARLCRPSCSPSCATGWLLGPRAGPRGVLAHFWYLIGLLYSSCLFCYGPDVTLQFFYSFGPIMICFLIYPAKHLSPPKLWKLLASNPYLCCFGEFHSNVGGVRFDLRTANKLPYT